MLSRVLSGACRKANCKVTFRQIQTKPFLTSTTLQPLPTANILPNNSAIKPFHFRTINTFHLHPNFQTNQRLTRLVVPLNSKIIKRGYFAPYYIFKEWEDTRSYRSDKWYRYQRSKRRRHKKWLKKTRVKRLVRKTLLENRVKAMREKRVRVKKERREKLKKAFEKKQADDLLRAQLLQAADERRRERLAKHEALMREMKEKRKERLRKRSTADN